MLRPLPVVALPVVALPVVVLLGLLTSCGDKEAPAPAPLPTAFCTDGQKSCVGNAATLCMNGTSWQVTACGEFKFCKDGECVAAACEKGSTVCGAGKDVKMCPSSGATPAVKFKTCTEDEACQKGVCVALPCKPGAKTCGWKSVLTCDDKGTWSASNCAVGELCQDAKCVKRTCEPDAIQCKSASVAQVCNVLGDKWNDKACPAGQGCFDGLCHTIVQSSPGADGGSTSTDGGSTGSDGGGPIASSDGKGFKDLGGSDIVLEANDVFTVVMSDKSKPAADAPVTSFDTVSASYLAGADLQMLQISATMGLLKLELQLAPVEQYTTGDFTPTGDASNTKVLFDDENAQAHGPQNWQWQSASYFIKIEQWDDPANTKDPRVKGTFAAEMGNTQDKPGAKMFFVNGKFDVAIK